VTASTAIADLLRAPLDPDWTVDGLAEQVLGAVASHPSDSDQEFVVALDDGTDPQSRRLLRPLLACLASKSAAEAGTPANLYGGPLAFERPGLHGPVWIHGRSENRPGNVRATLRRSNSPPDWARHPATPVADRTPESRPHAPDTSAVDAVWR
jgi:hypothetical protein